jgi:chromosome segregation protein
MKLTRLRLVGFKSFVEPTDVLIEPGLTGVVGPNGCGKSNLVEALRWVMGESSHKSLRASGMDDVIFAGSANRPARNTAEVSLVVDNGARTAPAVFNDADQLDVSRRIAREEGSTYRINGREVRARDVQLLFADAATGARSHAMVRQGMIGEIIAAKPQARRRILEDAAGIAGLHARRHEAEIRLKGAEENLLRIEDVLRQIDSQIDGLRRQARQASRYRSLAAEIRKAEALLLYLGWRGARDAVAEAQSKAEADLRQVAERTRLQAAAARDQAVAADALPGLREADAAAGAALQRLLLARDSLEAEEKRAEQRAAELDRRAHELARDEERERALNEDAAGAMARLDAEDEVLAGETDEQAAAAEEARERLEALEEALVISESAADNAQAALSDLAARRAAVERSLRELADRLARLSSEEDRVARELSGIDAASAADTKAADEEAEIEAAAEAVGMAEDRAEAAREAHRSAREREAALRGPAQEADRAAQRLETEVATLTKLLAGTGDDSWPRIIDAVAAGKGWETALAAALGDDLDASQDSGAPMHWADTGPGTGDPALPDGIESIAAHVTAPAAMTRRLRQTGIVSRADGTRLRPQLKPGQRLVSREGDLWRWDGFTAAAEAPGAAARRLAERNRLEDLEIEAARARAGAEAARAMLDSASAALRQASAEEGRALDLARETRRKLEDVRARHAAGARRRADIALRRSALAEAQARLEAEREDCAIRHADTIGRRDELSDAAELEARLAAMRAQVALDRQAVAEARTFAQGLAREAAMRERRRATIASERTAWRERIARADSHLAEIAERRGEVEEERIALAEAPEAFRERRRGILNGIAEAEEKKRATADRLAEAEREAASGDRAASEALALLAASREEQARSEARLEAQRARLADVVSNIAERLGSAPEDLPGIAGLSDSESLPDSAEVERRLDGLRQDRERLGAVNLRADEELAEVEGQREGLAAERDDLDEAVKRLRGAIGSLNREGRERLLAAFTIVQGHFERLFTTLFGGGMAQLELIESDDPLEAGLEIVARPPGKKPQTMTLLSGGEQALTAIALIFAVFLTNPSPICVLDEVDAPLDDANVERYCDLLRDMAGSTETRFLVITHNPVTMARMDRLYGVTMAERGVSQVVSVDLGTAERFREAS